MKVYGRITEEKESGQFLGEFLGIVMNPQLSRVPLVAYAQPNGDVITLPSSNVRLFESDTDEHTARKANQSNEE